MAISCRLKKLRQNQRDCPISAFTRHAVEAEIGKVGENQDTSSGELADVEDAMAFAAMGVDRLACGIGNIHGIYPANWPGLALTASKLRMRLIFR